LQGILTALDEAVVPLPGQGHHLGGRFFVVDLAAAELDVGMGQKTWQDREKGGMKRVAMRNGISVHGTISWKGTVPRERSGLKNRTALALPGGDGNEEALQIQSSEMKLRGPQTISGLRVRHQRAN
jgi:hypothetical protein